MSATTYLSQLNWGTGAAETSSTLGTDRLDLRDPPSQYHVSGLQITRMKDLLINLSTYFKGGARIQVVEQASNPFGGTESGFYVDTSGVAYKVHNGVASALGAAGGAMAIGGAVTSGTAGSILYVGAGSLLAQENGNLYYDETNNRVGLLTTTPRATLHIHGGRLRFTNATNGAANANEIWASADDSLSYTTRGSHLFIVDSDTVDSTDSFSIYRTNSAGTPILTVRTSSSRVGINRTTPGCEIEQNGDHCLGRISTGSTFSRFVGLGASADGTIVLGTSGGSQIEFYNTTGTSANGIYFCTHHPGASHARRAIIDQDGFWELTPFAVTSGTPTIYTVTAPAFVTLTASTEAKDINFNLARQVQFATGALTTQRAFLIQAPTYKFVGASVITNSATLAVSGAPIAGTNATLTNTYSIWAQAGTVRFDGGASIVGALTQITGAVSLTGNAASQVSTSSSTFTVDAATVVNLGTTSATSVQVGRSGQSIGFLGTSAIAKPTGGQDVTNSVTDSGSTAGTIPDITDGTTYANDYTNLRRALFQMARMLKQDHDALRAYGLLT